MKYECSYCEKIITNPLMEACGKYGNYFFCNKKCRDNYSKMLLERAIVSNPVYPLFCIGEMFIICIKRILKKIKVRV